MREIILKITVMLSDSEAPLNFAIFTMHSSLSIVQRFFAIAQNDS
jgi:hypothetical protein